MRIVPSEGEPGLATGAGEECPYERPFARSFEGCPAYLAERFGPADLWSRPLRPLWSCAHATPRRHEAFEARHYLGCGLGDRQARRRFREEVGAERLAAYNRLARTIEPILDPFFRTLASSGSRRPHLFVVGEPEGVTRAELGAALDLAIDAVQEALDGCGPELETAGVPREVYLTILRSRLHHLAEGREGGTWQPTPELLDLIEPAARRLFQRADADEAPVEDSRDIDKTG